jgi:hypothetical protein
MTHVRELTFTLYKSSHIKGRIIAGHQWLMPIIPATWEVEIRRIVVPRQPRQKGSRTPSEITKIGYGLSSQLC